MEDKKINYILIYPESHNHLGLFNDLIGVPNVELIVTRSKRVKNVFLNLVKKLHTSGTINRYVRLPLKRLWYNPINFNLDEKKEYCVIIVDAALKAFSVKELNRVFSMQNVRGVLTLINSMDAGSVGISEIRSKIFQVKWDDVYSFDPVDVKKYGMKYLGCCYYSVRNPEKIETSYEKDSSVKKSDVYFIGGLKGGREALILNTFKKMYSENLALDFRLMISGFQRFKDRELEEKIIYYSGGWMPYEKTLASVLKTNVILEILQENQAGPSLRYYEAVCYNKKLLTNNPNIVNFPYYNEKYMKIFHTADDIDIAWIKKEEPVEYFYKGDFSPLNMLDVVLH
ncbi:MAG: hypothetical protein Q4E91_12385 [Lachnospiraceae bacterium]|nr:hypothetical protein [Lachnospiraceae bacterium]